MSEPFAKMPQALIEDPTVTPAEIRVYAVLDLKAGKRGYWYGSWADLDQQFCIPKRTFRRAVAGLIRRGLIETRRQEPWRSRLLYTLCRGAENTTASGSPTPATDGTIEGATGGTHVDAKNGTVESATDGTSPGHEWHHPRPLVAPSYLSTGLTTGLTTEREKESRARSGASSEKFSPFTTALRELREMPAWHAVTTAKEHAFIDRLTEAEISPDDLLDAALGLKSKYDPAKDRDILATALKWALTAKRSRLKSAPKPPAASNRKSHAGAGADPQGWRAIKSDPRYTPPDDEPIVLPQPRKQSPEERAIEYFEKTKQHSNEREQET